MLKKIITKESQSLNVGRKVEIGKIMMVLNDFTYTRNGKYVINTTSYLINEDAENPTPNSFVYKIEGFDYYKIKVIDNKITEYNAEQIQTLFQVLNKEVLLTGDFDTQFADILNNAMLMVVGSENTFEVASDNWEFIN